jgi:hypothetical protein
VTEIKALGLKINIYSTKSERLRLSSHTYEELRSGDLRLVTNYAWVFFLLAKTVDIQVSFYYGNICKEEFCVNVLFSQEDLSI